MKILKFSLWTLCIIFCGCLGVQAECEYGLQAPQIAQVVATNRGKIVHLKTSADSCYGSNTSVYFSNYGTLPTWYVPNSGTIIHGYLWEEDPDGDDDELVKYYIGRFKGRVLNEFFLQETIRPGIIDSQGDQNCELYMTFSISGTTGGSPIPQGLFYYSICMN